MIYPLQNSIQYYSWGSTTAIPALLGDAPDGRPQAELWIGAHPKAPSTIGGDPLDQVIAKDPEKWLGDRVAQVFGRLPFLVKVLSAQEPLSIQCHPDLAQAKEGFHREESAGIALNDRSRNYRDPEHKPELICALTPFRALKGFRPIPEIIELGQKLGATSLVDALRTAGLRGLFETLMTQPAPETAIATDTVDHEVAFLIRELRQKYPGDPGVLAPLFLNPVTLAPGQGLFLRPRELHTYLSGTAVEVMASSDNVLRGGLTRKHIDVQELIRVLAFEASTPQVLDPKESRGERHYRTPAHEFALSIASVKDIWAPEARDGVEIVLVVEGQLSFNDLSRRPGQAAVVPGNSEYTARGSGKFFRVRVPG